MSETTLKKNQKNSEPFPQENFVSTKEPLTKDTYVSNVESKTLVSMKDLELSNDLIHPKLISKKSASQNEILNLLEIENKFVSTNEVLPQNIFVSSNESNTFATINGIEIINDPVKISDKNATQNVVSNLINANFDSLHESPKSFQGNCESKIKNTESLHKKFESLDEYTDESLNQSRRSFHEKVGTLLENTEDNNTVKNLTESVVNDLNIENRINALKEIIEEERNISKLNRASPNQYIKEIPKEEVEILIKKFEESEKSNQKRLEKERIKKMTQFINFDSNNNKNYQKQKKSKRNGHYYNSPSIIIFKNNFMNKTSEDNLNGIHHSSQQRFEGGLCAKKSENEIMDCINVCNCKFCEGENVESSEEQYQKMCQWIYNRGRSVMDRVKNMQLGPLKVGEDELMPSNYGCGWIVCRKPKRITKSKYDIIPYDPLIMKRQGGGGGNEKYESDENLVQKITL